MHNGDGVTAMHICLMALNCALKHGRSGLCYVMLSVIYHNFAVGQWSLPGPGTDGREGVRPGWRAGGMAPDRRGGAEVPAGPFPGWLCLGTAGCPHVLRCSPAWRWLLRNVNKSLKINILLNFSHSRLFVQFFFSSPKQCLQANPGKISTFTFLLIWFRWVVVNHFLDCLLEGMGSVQN